MARKTCAICGKVITEQFYVCMKCIKEYDIPYKYTDWPRWLKDLVNIELKNLRLLRIEEKYLSTDSLGYPFEGKIIKKF